MSDDSDPIPRTVNERPADGFENIRSFKDATVRTWLCPQAGELARLDDINKGSGRSCLLAPVSNHPFKCTLRSRDDVDPRANKHERAS
jgi:hypothetical protein